MSTLREQQEAAREAWLDFGYELVKALGLIKLVRRLGLTPKAWVLEREIRELHR